MKRETEEGKYLTGIRDPRHMTFGQAEELKKQGAYLEIDNNGFVHIFAARPAGMIHKGGQACTRAI